VRRPGVTTAVVLVVAALAAVTLAATILGSRPLPGAHGLSLALHVGVALYAGSVAALVAGRARDTRDPHAVFVATGLVVISAQSAIVAGWELVASRGVGMSLGDVVRGTGIEHQAQGGAIAPFMWMSGWLVAGCCFVLALPPWDRRGRPPIPTIRVAVVASAALVATDVVVALASPDLSPHAIFWDAPGLEPTARVLGAAWWVLAIAGAGLFGVASIREARLARRGGGASTHPWLASAWALAVVLLIAVFLRPTEGLGAVQWADALQPVIVALVFAGFLASHRDESSRMRRASDRADEILGGRAEIASVVAHEVRGPVATLKGLAATALTSYERLSDAERREFIGLIEEESVRLLAVVDQTSLALKVDAGTVTLDRRRQPLEPIVRESIARVNASGRPVDLDADDQIAAVVDRRWLGEAIRQAVDNADKFSPAGTPIHVRLSADETLAAIEVADHGPGIPKDRRDDVFTKFTTWRPPGYEDRPGPGLGLFICRGLVTLLDGDASFADAPNGGTMLRIRVRTKG
jgi:signal transduction histidine kinase